MDIEGNVPEPLSRQIEKSNDAIDLTKWYPAQTGVIPEFRIGKRWISSLWLIPFLASATVVAFMVGQELWRLDSVQQFVKFYPGYSNTLIVHGGFPVWIRLAHVFNLFMLMFIMRSGIQILADHPRLYLENNSTPGREWFRFQKPVPTDRVWTARDDAVTLPGWFGLPGVRHTIGLARWWHFSCDMLWFLNGLIFYVLLFSTGQWERLIPTSWDVFPNALSDALQYLALRLPAENGWIRYNSLQQLAYFTTVFIAAPLAIISGIMQSPAISNRTGWFGKVFNRQVARTIHFAVLLYFVQFIVVHVMMVFVTGFRRNLNHITIGTDDLSWTGTYIAAGTALVFVALWACATPFTLRHSRIVQRVGRAIVGALMGRMEIWSPSVRYTEKDIAPFLWPNGQPPDSDEFNSLVEMNLSITNCALKGSWQIRWSSHCPAKRNEKARTDHQSLLYPRMVWCCEMGRRSDD